MKKVLILEDEENIRSFVVINLRRAGYQVVEAGTGAEALEMLRQNPDIGVAILDIMLPDIDGFEVCRRIRATSKQIGIIMLTARTQEMDKVTGLMTGADDYVTKPCSPFVLMKRVAALLRRGDNSSESKVMTIDELKERGLWLYAADMDGTAYTKTDLKGAVGIVLGSEGFGISRLVKEKCDFVVSIPLYGSVNSLNVSCAAAIILTEVARQKHEGEI